MSTAPIRFGIVGSGWRAEFFARLARALPERLAVAGVVTRSAERAAQVEAGWGCPPSGRLANCPVANRSS